MPTIRPNHLLNASPISQPAATSDQPQRDTYQPAPPRPVAKPQLPQPLAPLVQVSRGALRSHTVAPGQSLQLQGRDALVFVQAGTGVMTDATHPDTHAALPAESALATTRASRLTLANKATRPLRLLAVDLTPGKLPKPSHEPEPTVTGLPINVAQPNQPPQRTVPAPDGTAVRLLAENASEGGGMITASLPPHCVSTAVRHKTVEEIWSVQQGGGTFHLVGPDAQPHRSFALEVGTVFTIPTGATFQFESGAEGLRSAVFTMPRWPGEAEGELVQGPLEPSPKDASGYTYKG